MPQTVVLANGVSKGFANIALILSGVPIIGITKLSYKRKQNKENLYGAGYEPVSRGMGNVEYEASMEIYIEEWERIVNASPNRNPFLIPAFDIPIVFSGTNPKRIILKAAEFMEAGIDSSQNDTKILMTIPLIIAGIQE